MEQNRSVRARVGVAFALAVSLAIIGVGYQGLGAQGSVYYVRQGANGTGNGSDWTNAYPTLPSSLQRGATYYVADGAYGSYFFDDAPSGTSVTTIKKATVADHGTNTGWVNTYGDGQATWTRWSFATAPNGFYTFDGQVRNADWAAGYGFKVGPPGGTGTNNRAVDMFLNDATSHQAHNVTFRYVDIEGNGLDNATHDDCINSQNGNNNVTIQYSYIHDCGRTFIITGRTRGWTVEYSLLARSSSDPEWHGEAWSLADDDDLTVRYNRFEDFEGTGGLVAIGARFSGANDNWQIYGNTFAISPGNPYRRDDGISDGIVAFINSGSYPTNFKFFNNTILNFNAVGGYSTRIELEQANGSNVQVYNNFWWNSRPATHIFNGCTNCVARWNRYDNTGSNSGEADRQVNTSALQSVFVNYLEKDFHLTGPTLPGTVLTSPFTLDPDGNARGGDGNWDRGAYEFGSGPVTTAPAAPTNVRVQ